MDVFGDAWKDHVARLQEGWRARVADTDTVLIAGDISWAMKEYEAVADFSFLRTLPGTKVLLKGNHDYWWSTKRRVLQLAGAGFDVVQACAVVTSGFAIVGARGWESIRSADNDASNRMYLRELERLRLSLAAGKKTGLPLLAMTHYPPLAQTGEPTPVTTELERAGVQLCVYGHLHGEAARGRCEGLIRGVHYRLVAADHVAFTPVQLA
jgi:predicted phosphohydrolase